MTLQQYLRAAAQHLGNSPTPALDARVLARHALGLDDAGLILAGPKPIGEDERGKIDALIERRARGEPVARIVGEKEFFGLSIKLLPGVLVPRPETETIVEAALRRRPKDAPLRILDLGTGSGCLLCALLSEFPNATGLGVDKDADAARIAQENLDRLGFAARGTIRRADWTELLDDRIWAALALPPPRSGGGLAAQRRPRGQERRELPHSEQDCPPSSPPTEVGGDTSPASAGESHMKADISPAHSRESGNPEKSGSPPSRGQAGLALRPSNALTLPASVRGRAARRPPQSAAPETLGTFDLIVSNPPYIPDGERERLPVDVRDYERPEALFAGADGLDAYRSLFALVPRLVGEKSLIAFEFGEGQAPALLDLARAAFPRASFAVESDLSGRPRIFVVETAQNKH
jgi:methylase of polypeptide subunit release factors